MIAGTVYGVALNDNVERDRLASAFHQPPYKAPPNAPVLYIKSRNTFRPGGAQVRLPLDVAEVEAAATIGLLFGRDAVRCDVGSALTHVAAACLALDLSEPRSDYYRPAVRQRCRDGFLPLGEFAAFDPAVLMGEIVTAVGGVEMHRWSLARLVRGAAMLISDISAFMTLSAGDVLLIGLPHDAPHVTAGWDVVATAEALPSLHTSIARQETP